MANVSNISKALNIIEQYEPEAIFSTDATQIWCGEGNGKSVTEITDEGRAIMESLDWFVDTKLGCWSRYL